MTSLDHETLRLGELIVPAFDGGEHEPVESSEGRRRTARAVLHLLRSRPRTLLLPPPEEPRSLSADRSK